MRSILALGAIAGVFVLAGMTVGEAHDSWINHGGYKNSLGEFCCGDNDCESPEQVTTAGTGWVVRGAEFVPFSEAVPSPDGKLWICRRSDNSRRCVFGPPPGS